MRLPAKAPRRSRNSRCKLSTADAPTIAEVHRQPEKKKSRSRCFFVIPVPGQSCSAEIFWREHPLGEVEVPIVTAADFVQGFAVEMPTVHVGSRGARRLLANRS